MELPFIYDRSNLRSFIKRNRVRSHGSRPNEKSDAGGQTTRMWNQLFFASKNFTDILFLPPPPYLSVGKRRVCLGSVVNFLSKPCGEVSRWRTKLEGVDGQKPSMVSGNRFERLT